MIDGNVEAETPFAETPFAETPFAEPWQAQAFALKVMLQDKGVFTGDEWAQAFSAQLHQPGACDDASDYYDRWVATLEQMLVARGLTSSALVSSVATAWQRAAEATPHGKMIELANDPTPTRGWTRRSFSSEPRLRPGPAGA